MQGSRRSGSRGLTVVLVFVVLALAGVAIYVGIELQNTDNVNPTQSEASSNYCPIGDNGGIEGRDNGESCNGNTDLCCDGLGCFQYTLEDAEKYNISLADNRIDEGEEGYGVCEPLDEYNSAESENTTADSGMGQDTRDPDYCPIGDDGGKVGREIGESCNGSDSLCCDGLGCFQYTLEDAEKYNISLADNRIDEGEDGYGICELPSSYENLSDDNGSGDTTNACVENDGESCNGSDSLCCNGLMCFEEGITSTDYLIEAGDAGTGVCRTGPFAFNPNNPTGEEEDPGSDDNNNDNGGGDNNDDNGGGDNNDNTNDTASDDNATEDDDTNGSDATGDQNDIIADGDSGFGDSYGDGYNSTDGDEIVYGGKDENNVVGGKNDGYADNQGSDITGGKNGDLPNTAVHIGLLIPAVGIVLTLFALLRFDSIRHKAIRFKYFGKNDCKIHDISKKKKNQEEDILKKKLDNVSSIAKQVNETI